jgi:DNA-binding CsgD family transcriptional regulator
MAAKKMMAFYKIVFRAWQKAAFRPLFWGGIVFLSLVGIGGGGFLFLELFKGGALQEISWEVGLLAIVWMASVGFLLFVNHCRKRFHFLYVWGKEVESGLDYRYIKSSVIPPEKLDGREKLWDGVYQAYFKQEFEKWGFMKAEIEVGVLMLYGMSQDEIAACRKTTLKTVKNQATVIYEKAQVKNGKEFLSRFLLMLLPHLNKIPDAL